jgi:uncharacterized membrane protein (DUF373 family)
MMRSFISTLTLKRVIIIFLIVLMYILVIFSLVELAEIVWHAILYPPYLLQTGELIEIFGQLLLVLVGIELLDTVQVYLSDDEVHAEVVIEAAIIGVARKAILLELKDTPPVAILGLAALLIALAAGYYVLRLTHGRIPHRGSGRDHPTAD